MSGANREHSTVRPISGPPPFRPAIRVSRLLPANGGTPTVYRATSTKFVAFRSPRIVFRLRPMSRRFLIHARVHICIGVLYVSPLRRARYPLSPVRPLFEEIEIVVTVFYDSRRRTNYAFKRIRKCHHPRGGCPRSRVAPERPCINANKRAHRSSRRGDERTSLQPRARRDFINLSHDPIRANFIFALRIAPFRRHFIIVLRRPERKLEILLNKDKEKNVATIEKKLRSSLKEKS